MATVLRIRLPRALLSCSGRDGESENGVQQQQQQQKRGRGVRRVRDEDSSAVAMACAQTTAAAKRARTAAARDQRRVQSTLAPFLFPLVEQQAPVAAVETTPVAAPAAKRAGRARRGRHKTESAPAERTLVHRSCGFSAIGGRDENQDTFFELAEDADGTPLPCRAWGVLDGHGAHGATASRVAAECICEHLRAAFASRHPDSFTTRAAKTILKDAFMFVFWFFSHVFFFMFTYVWTTGKHTTSSLALQIRDQRTRRSVGLQRQWQFCCLQTSC